MKKSLPICLPAALPDEAGLIPADSGEEAGQYISNVAGGNVRRVRVRRRAIRIPDGRITAALRAYRENAVLV